MRGSMPPADIEALHAMREAIVSAECRGDLSFFVATLDDDAVVMPPDAPAREGKAACLAFVRDVLQGMLALFLARWLQTSPAHQGIFGAEFRQLRLGVVLGGAGGLVVVLALFTQPLLIDDLRSVFIAALTLVGLAALHRAVVSGKLRRAWLWFTYIMLGLVVTAAPMVIALAGWGFVDNWLRSQRVAATTAAGRH